MNTETKTLIFNRWKTFLLTVAYYSIFLLFLCGPIFFGDFFLDPLDGRPRVVPTLLCLACFAAWVFLGDIINLFRWLSGREPYNLN
jgi:hypothetical protein